MKTRPNRFYIIAVCVLLLMAFSGVYTSYEILRLTGSFTYSKLWLTVCVLFQGPILLVPFDRARVLGFLNRKLPQWLFIMLVGWTISQVLTFLLFPILFFIPSKIGLFGLFPGLIYLGVLFILFKSMKRVVEKKVEIKLQSLPQDWKPLTILQLSDIHSGPFMLERHLEKIVTKLNTKLFDLCVITGDVVNHSAKELKWTLQTLEKLNSPHGTFAAIGNHEYIDDEKAVIEGYRNSKIKLILNSSHVVQNEKFKIRLIGVDFPFETEITSEKEITEALNKSLDIPVTEDELQILLAHHPNGFDVAKAMKIPITLSGHTHGGQIEIFGKNVIASFVKYVKGLYQDGEAFLYVNSGLGNWMPFRINVPCEYTLITITK